ncbi:NUDIX domain-containing protein [Beijerinckia indica]|uniref:GDP-mannose pyrophosphatase n=1 Tax=Beijerinckia indica subsp. indica (strain ATCC 9039 / DSM 1715 / NCIMB 8712) TaxID=395963 RepID=B2IHJ1_BEII9|nr:NUDIX domain-containing protein [Beijerinckia indica]ACB94512.1 NUDIX hydrolase [Beijerinckia indica subsp. indica ATCC 9039]
MPGSLRILGRKLLSEGFGRLERIVIDRKRFNGEKQDVVRELYDTGHGAAILLYDASRSRVLLVRQFRLPAYIGDARTSLVEVCAGKLEGDEPHQCIVREVREETGFAIANPQFLFSAYSSPGCFAEKIFYFAAPYHQDQRVGPGGGLATEAEDIEILEPTLDEALAMIETGEISDAKTIVLLFYAKLHNVMQD